MMKYAAFVFFALLSSVCLRAEEVLSSLSFADAGANYELTAGEVQDDGSVRVASVSGPSIQRLIELKDPGITRSTYALTGMIRYDGVEGDGYLQLNNDFGENGTFHTKSVATTGPLQTISGSSDWRVFVLPFNASAGEGAAATVLTPESLSLDLVFPGKGTVFLRGVELRQYEEGEDPMRTGGQWFSGRNIGMMGGIGGAVVGLWGALIGVLASRGQARSFAIGSANTLIVAGIISFGVGLVMLVSGRGVTYYYPLLLTGFLLVVVIGSIRRSLPRRYERVELEKMQAMDS